MILNLLISSLLAISLGEDRPITVGSKNFTESYILAELLSQTIEDRTPHKVRRLFGIGGTGMVFESLKKGELDVYVEYTGTLSEAILKNPKLKSIEALKQELGSMGLVISNPLGFNNTYALAMRRADAEASGIRTLSDLQKNANKFRYAFSYEFMARSDGFEALRAHYRLPKLSQIRRMDHALVYEAIMKQQVDVIEVYSTDAKVKKMDLLVLKDDKSFFPDYSAVLLTTADFVRQNPQAWQALLGLENSLNEETMRELNAEIEIEKKSFAQVVSIHLNKEAIVESGSVATKVWKRTKEHLFLVLVSLVIAVGIGIPLGILAVKSVPLGQFVLVTSGLLQTIPSLALLCFLIPFFSVGAKPAIIALILYGLLPVVINTYEGLKNLDPKLVDSSLSLSLTPLQRLVRIFLPLASPQIFAGIKTAAIISIGTATLAAFIGAGGYGAPIITGLALNDMPTILMGAIPAAVMAICAHALFEALRFLVIPRGLRVKKLG